MWFCSRLIYMYVFLSHIHNRQTGYVHIIQLPFENKSLVLKYHLGQKVLSRIFFFKGQQFHLDLWQCDLKINRGHLLSRGIHCTKFGNFQAKRSKDIEKTSLGLQTDRQVQNNMLPFYKGGHKNMLQLESNCLQIHVSWA